MAKRVDLGLEQEKKEKVFSEAWFYLVMLLWLSDGWRFIPLDVMCIVALRIIHYVLLVDSFTDMPPF